MTDRYTLAQPGWWVVLYDNAGSFQSAHPVVAWTPNLTPLTWDSVAGGINSSHYLSEDFGTVIYYPKADFIVRVLDETIPDYKLPNIDLEGA